VIIGLNGEPVTSYIELVDKKRNLKDQDVTLTVLRVSDTVSVGMHTDANARLGFDRVLQTEMLDFATKEYTLLGSLPAGVKKGWNTLVVNVQNFKLLFTSKEVKASESLGSFLTIGGMFGEQWDWQRFWTMTALLSIVLAFMNILPIPALDGGHVVFTIYEMITGHKPSEKFLEYAQLVGMVLLMGLMVYALGLDIFRLFK
jgi:regulator of sigma E protease